MEFIGESTQRIFPNFLLRELDGFSVILDMPIQIRSSSQPGKYAALRRVAGVMGIFALAALMTSAGGAREDTAAKMPFDLPTDDAERSLKRFSAQSGLEVLFVSETAANVRTNAVKGEYAPWEALDRMLAGTKLTAMRDEKTSAIRIISATSVNRQTGSSDSAAATQSSKKKRSREIQESRCPVVWLARPGLANRRCGEQ